jgi:excinuclease ABC subunit C
MIDQIEALVVHTEAEALLAEQNFIKQYKPRFNVRLRDDKSYPYIAISLDEEFPRVYFTRERHRRDRAYFGPYSNAKRVRETLDLLGKVFMFRTCDGPEPGRRSGSPCLDYYIKRCEAPCVGYVSKEEYRAGIDGVIDFLSGRYRSIERTLKDAMQAASDEQRFEDAARERNRLRAVPSTRSPWPSKGPRRTPRCSRSGTGSSRTARASISTTRPRTAFPPSWRPSSSSITGAR